MIHRHCIKLLLIACLSNAFVVPRKRFSSSYLCMSDTNAVKPTVGSIVTAKVELKPEGDFVPEPLFDTSGTFKFVLGGGNYLPGLHDLISSMSVGEVIEGETLDAGWGARREDLVAEIPKSQVGEDMQSQIKVGTELMLANGLKCVVTAVNDEAFTIDANPPLAGATYKATVELLAIEDGPAEFEYTPVQESKYKVATFALGCFWGGELEFMREHGVVGTKVGYTQGQMDNPSYKDVCSGTTGHTEAIMVTFDENEVSYEQLVHLAMDRLGENKYLLNQVGNDRGTQYRHGVYYHDDIQKALAKEILESFGEDCQTEMLPATKFWDAEDYHQQYLLKGGQSAKKGEDSTIRCYG